MDESKRKWLERPELPTDTGPGEPEGVLGDPQAMMAIFFMVMNFLWIFPTLGAVFIWIQNPVDRIDGRIDPSSLAIEHWLSVGIIFLQLIFFNGWLFTRRLMPDRRPASGAGDPQRQ